MQGTWWTSQDIRLHDIISVWIDYSSPHWAINWSPFHTICNMSMYFLILFHVISWGKFTLVFFLIQKFKKPIPSSLCGDLGAGLLERPKPPNKLLCKQISRVSGSWGKCHIPLLPGTDACAIYVLIHSQPTLHFYISFLIFPNATFRPRTRRRRLCSLRMDVCQNKIGQGNQHKRLMFICLGGRTWTDIVETETNRTSFVLFSERDGRTVVVKAAEILSLRFYYAV